MHSTPFHNHQGSELVRSKTYDHHDERSLMNHRMEFRKQMNSLPPFLMSIRQSLTRKETTMAMASMDKKVRYVRCAKCLKLLIEFADVPVYQCGGCGTLLQAKYYRAPKESGTLGSLENNIPDTLPEDPSLGSGTALEKQIAPSTAADSSELTHVEDNGVISTLSSSSPSAEQNCYQRGEPSNDVETGTKEIVSDTAPLAFRSSAEYMAENRSGESAQTETGKCSNKEAENSPKYIHQGSEDLMLGHKLEEASSFRSSGEYRAESQPDKSTQTETEKCSNEESDNSPKHRHKVNEELMLGRKLEEASGFISSAESSAETRPEKSFQTETENYSNEEAGKSPKYTHQSSENLMCHKLGEVLIIDQPACGSITEYTFKSEAGESIKAECLNEEVGKPTNLSQPDSNSSMTSDKLEESPESVNHRITSEDDFLAIEYLSSPNRSCQTYEGSISSLDDRSNDCFIDRYLFSPAGSFRQQRILNSDDSKERGGDALGTNKMVIYPPSKLQDHTFKSLSDKHIDRFGSNREESSSRYRICRQERGTSYDSASFHSVQDRMDYECSIGAASRGTHLKGDSHNHENGSTSVKIGDLEQDNSELLRKVDELRHQLNELYDQREGKTRYHAITHSQQNLFFNHNSQQAFSHDLKPNSVRHPQGAYYRPRISVPRYNQFSQMSLSGETRCSCLHCQSEDRHMPLLPNYRHSSPCGACAYNICSHPPNNVNPHHPIGYGMHELGLEKLLHKNKRQTSKRHCRPLSGAAPFVICNKCLKLLQLPADFLISRRRLQKLQCGACSKILLLAFHSGPSMSQTPSQVFHPPSGIGSDTDAPTGHQISEFRADNCPEGDRLSFSEEYGPSFTQSYSTETTPVLNILGNSSEERKAREEHNSTLHRLMGYGSATEILYQPSDDDEGYESAEPTRSYSYRLRGKPNDNKLRGKEVSSSQSFSSLK